MFRTQRINTIHRQFLPSTVPSNTSLGGYQSHYAVAHALKLNEIEWARAFLLDAENLLHRSDVLRKEDALDLLLLDFEAVWHKLSHSDVEFLDWTQCIRNAVPMIAEFWSKQKGILDAWVQGVIREDTDSSIRKAFQHHFGLKWKQCVQQQPQSLFSKGKSVGISIDAHANHVYGGCFITERLFLSWSVDGTFTLMDIYKGAILVREQMDDSLAIEHCTIIGQYAFLATYQQVMRLDIDKMDVQGVISQRFIGSNGRIQAMHNHEGELYVLVSKGLLVLNPTTCKPVKHMIFKLKNDPMYLSVHGFRRMTVLSEEKVILAKRKEWQCINPIEKQVKYRPSNPGGQIQHVQCVFEDYVLISTSTHVGLYSSQTWEGMSELEGDWTISQVEESTKSILLYNQTDIVLWEPLSKDVPSSQQTEMDTMEVHTEEKSSPNTMRVMQSLQDGFTKMGGLEEYVRAQLTGLNPEEREIRKQQIMQGFVTMFAELDAQKTTPENPLTEEVDSPKGTPSGKVLIHMTAPASNVLGGAGMDDTYVVTWSRGRGTELFAMPQELLDNQSLDDGSIFVFSRSDGRLLHTLHGHTSTIMDVRPIRTDIWTSVSADGSVALWDFRAGELMGKVQFHTGEIQQVATQRGCIVTMSNQGTINQIQVSEMIGHTTNIRSHTGEVKGVRVLKDTQIVSWGTDGDIWIWDWQLGRPIQQLSGHTYVVSNVLVESSSKIISIGLDNKIIEWGLVNGKWVLVEQWSKESLPQECSYVLTSNKPRPLRTEVGGVYKDAQHWLNSDHWKVWVESGNHVVCSQGSQVQVVKFPV